MTSAAYPSRQPFPRSTALRGETGDELVSSALEPIVTLELVPFERALRELRAYCADYARPDPEEGLALGIEGPHGSGKTHLIRYLRAQAAKLRPDALQLYVKLNGPDPLEMYRGIMASVSPSVLQDVNTSFLVELAKQEARNLTGAVDDAAHREPPGEGAGESAIATRAEMKAGADELAEQFVATLSDNPLAVYQYLDKALLSRSKVEREQSDWVVHITKADDFFHAVSYLQDPVLGSEAYKWFRGEPLSETTLARLGVNSAIDTSERARAALFFIAAILGRARRPLLVFIDQLERLMPAGDAATCTANVAMLHSLAEWFQDHQAFLCIAGSTEAWQLTPPDFRGRFRRVFRMPQLDARETLDLVKLYLSPAEDFSPFQSEADVYPFTVEAIEETVHIASGNVRSMLRLAYQAFADASPERRMIGREEIKHAFSSFDEYFDRATILAQVKRLLGDAGIPFSEQTTDSSSPDFSIPGAANPVAFIEVSDAVFHEDEMRKAIRYVESAARLRGRFPRARLILIIAGYATAEVLRRLREITDSLFVYAPERFINEFRSTIESVKPAAVSASSVAPPAAAGPPGPPGPAGPQGPQGGSIAELQATLASVRKEFESLLDQRLQETEQLRSRTVAFTTARKADQERRTGADVAAAKRAIAEAESARVSAARADKERFESAWRESRRTEAEQLRARRALQYVGGLSAAGIVGGYLASFAVTPTASGAFFVGGGALGIIVGLLVGWLSMRGPGPAFDAARKSVPDLQALDRIAARVGREALQDSTFALALNDRNPQVRYVVARVAAVRSMLDSNQLLTALRAEIWIKPIPHLLSAVSRHASGPTIAGIVEYALLASDGEILYALETLSRTSPTELSAETRKRLNEHLQERPLFVHVHALCLQWEFEALSKSRSENFALSFAAGLGGQSPRGMGGRLASLFFDADLESPNYAEQLQAAELDGIATERVDELLQIFGLGTDRTLGYYDDLGNTGKYKDVYRFLLGVRLALEEFSTPSGAPPAPAARERTEVTPADS
jgi:hypothetical protein